MPAPTDLIKRPWNSSSAPPASGLSALAASPNPTSSITSRNSGSLWHSNRAWAAVWASKSSPGTSRKPGNPPPQRTSNRGTVQAVEISVEIASQEQASQSGGFFLRQPDQPKFVLNRPGRPVVLGQLVRADSICRRKDLRQETGRVQQGDQRQDPVIRPRRFGLCLG